MTSKAILADFICQLNNRCSFRGQATLWSTPILYFSGCGGSPATVAIPKFVKDLQAKNILREDINDLICVLGDWDNVADGIFFTDQAIYVSSPKNQDKSFRIRYDDISDLILYSDGVLEIADHKQKHYHITYELWNVHAIKLFLEFASAQYHYSESDLNLINDILLPQLNNQRIADVIAGTIYGNVSTASTIYGEEKFHASRGHGFAAERANTLLDIYTGHDARIVGDNNAKNGADRIVDNVQIQSKYCNTGSKCVSECFESGQFRYFNADGTPMKIEVPADKYDSAVTAMQERIRRGEVSGVTDPQEAQNIICKGHFTYEQAKNIARAGTIDSIKYDAANGIIIASSSFGMTAIISFATSIWNGESIDIALKNAALGGLKVGGVSFATAVLAGQLSKAGLNSLLVGSSDAVIKILGPKGSALLANAFRQGKNIYGAAAMKSASKMLRGNAITGAVSVIVLSAGDIINIFQGRISGGQLFKNIANTVSSVAGGTAGWVGGVAAGATVGSAIPLIGTAIGGLVGGVIGALGGGAIAGELSNAVLDNFIEDDANAMLKIIEDVFVQIAQDYLLTQREVEHIVDRLGEDLTGGDLKDMYACQDKTQYANTLLVPLIEQELQHRQRISLPDIAQMQKGLKLALEEISDSDNIKAADQMRNKRALAMKLCEGLEEKSYEDLIAIEETITQQNLNEDGIISDIFGNLKKLIDVRDKERRTVNGIIYDTFEVAELARNHRQQVQTLCRDLQKQSYEELAEIEQKIVNQNLDEPPGCISDFYANLQQQIEIKDQERRTVNNVMYKTFELAELARTHRNRMKELCANLEEKSHRQIVVIKKIVDTENLQEPDNCIADMYEQLVQIMYTKKFRTGKWIAALLAILLGLYGAHKFYLGHHKQGVIYFAITTISILLICIQPIAGIIGLFALFALQISCWVEGIRYIATNPKNFSKFYQCK